MVQMMSNSLLLLLYIDGYSLANDTVRFYASGTYLGVRLPAFHGPYHSYTQ